VDEYLRWDASITDSLISTAMFMDWQRTPCPRRYFDVVQWGVKRQGKAGTFGEVRDAVAQKTTVPTVASPARPTEHVEVLPEYRAVQRLVQDNFPLTLVTGGAGTGKSTFIRWLDEQFSGHSVLCAPTGIAALTIRGKTVHSLCRLPPAWIVEKDIRVVEKSQAILKKAKVVVIDEISMVNANLLDAVDHFFRMNRGDSSPFGGVSVVMVGDLFQLPPVVTSSTRHLFDAEYSSPKFFAAHCISSSPFEAFELTKAFRQVDQDFVDLLGRIRRGRDLEQSVSRLNASVLRSGDPPEGAVWLCPRNADVERVNASRLESLPGAVREYEAVSSGAFKDGQTPVASTIRLKVGAQVVMANNTKAWVNGSVATVRQMSARSIKVTLSGGSKLLEVQQNQWDQFDYVLNKETGEIDRTVVGTFSQLPVKLSWAMTIHKSQGLTLPKVHLDLGAGAFESGQTYVALSRCRRLEDISLARDIRPGDVQVDPEATAFYEEVID